MIVQRLLSGVNLQQLRSSSRSALYVSGRNAQKQYAVFLPKISVPWIRSNRETLERVNEARNGSIDIGALVHELETYESLKAQVEENNRELVEIRSEINKRKERNEDISRLRARLTEIKENMKSSDTKEAIWELEESAVLDYLSLQNCDCQSRFTENLFYSRTSEEKNPYKKYHKELCVANDLVEFSPNSHTAYYLKNELALLELKLSNFFTSKLLEAGFEIFSNPDFVKSVLAEGSGLNIFNENQIFALKKYQDFGDRSSCNAVHLVGGASLSAFSGYFSRNIVLSPQVFPALMFCVGRQYSPQPGPASSLLSSQQSQAVQVLGVTTSLQDMDTQLTQLLHTLLNTFSSFPNLTITESRLQDCETSNSRQFRLDIEVSEER